VAAGLLPSPLGADILALLGGVPGAADSFLLVCWGSADVVRWRDVEALRRSLTKVAYVLRCSFGVGIPWLNGAHGVSYASCCIKILKAPGVRQISNRCSVVKHHSIRRALCCAKVTCCIGRQ
jgi:hypothetical protein